MASNTDWRREALDAARKEQWSLHGPGRLVKVTARSGPDVPNALRTTAGGYFTLAKYINGKRPPQIERDLGLPANFLLWGAIVYNFRRLPLAFEYSYELTARHPDGLAYNPAHFDPGYGPGSASIHQWKIRDGVVIPVDTASAVVLDPGDRFRA